MKKIKLTIKGEELRKKLKIENGKDGYIPVKGKDYFDGKKGDKGDKGNDAEPVDTDQIVATSTERAIQAIKPTIPTMAQLKNELPPDTRLQIVDKINTGKKDDLKIEAEQVSGLDKMHSDTLNRAVSILDQRTQFLINKQTGTSTDELVKLNASDPAAGYLDDKILGYGFLTAETDPLSLHLDGLNQASWTPTTTLVPNLNADLWDGYNFSDYLDQAVKTTSSPTFANLNLLDNAKTKFGTAADATAYYDGTNLVINPKEVGSGLVQFRGNTDTGWYDYPANGNYNHTIRGYSSARLDFNNYGGWSNVRMTAGLDGDLTFRNYGSVKTSINAYWYRANFAFQHLSTDDFGFDWYPSNWTVPAWKLHAINISHPVSDFYMKAMYAWGDGSGNSGAAYRRFHFDRDNHFGLTMDSVATQAAITQGVGGAIADGTYYYLITTLGPDGLQSGTNSARYRAVTITAGGGTASAALSWTAVTGAVTYKIYRSTVAGTWTNTFIANVTAPTTTYTDTAAAPSAGTPPTENAGFAIKLDAYSNSYFNLPIILYDKLILTQTDGNEYIDSLNDGYVDIGATTGIDFNIGATEQISLIDGVFAPTTDSDVDLGTSSLYWKNAYIDSLFFGSTTEAVLSGGIQLVGSDWLFWLPTSGRLIMKYGATGAGGDRFTFDNNGNLTISGTFYGDGSGLTSVPTTGYTGDLTDLNSNIMHFSNGLLTSIN